jgi:GT2 family glycosyltransferase
VDNFVNKEYSDLLEKSLNKEVILYRYSTNVGFAAACNKGVELSRGDSVIFINPDVYITKASLMNFINKDIVLRKSSLVGVTGINIEGENHSSTVVGSKFPTIWDLFCELIGYKRAFVMTLKEGGVQEIDQVIGAFFCTTRDLWHRFKGFDEQFFVYYEELDFCYRLYVNGYRNYIFSDIKMVHVSGGASKNAGFDRMLYQLRSKALYYRKHFLNLKWIAFVVVFFEMILRLLIFRKLNLFNYSLKFIWKK